MSRLLLIWKILIEIVLALLYVKLLLIFLIVMHFVSYILFLVFIRGFEEIVVLLDWTAFICRRCWRPGQGWPGTFLLLLTTVLYLLCWILLELICGMPLLEQTVFIGSLILLC